jgi:hypothetical protein
MAARLDLRWFRACSSRVLGLGLVLGVVAAAVGMAGCGQGLVPESPATGAVVSSTISAVASNPGPGGARAPTTETSSGLATGTSAAATSLPSTVTSGSGSDRDYATLFAELAAATAPMTIFAPTYLPEDASLPEHWSPVIDSQRPEGYAGPPVSNPQTLGAGADSEVQVILRAGDGWLAIIENFRGDLGDVTGLPVGSVSGNTATLYEVNGGELVQWSEDGRWYGVFGRDVSRDEVVAVALGMEPASPSTP